MFLNLDDVLNTDEAAQLCARLAAGGERGPATEKIVSALTAHPLFTLGAHPRRFSTVTFRALDGAEEREAGVAEAVVGGVRADVGVVVLLSDESSFDGGEVTLDIGYGAETHRLARGACIAYPASARRGDLRVTRGKRWTAELWVQSLVRAPAQREILYDMGCSLHLLELFPGADSGDIEQLRRSQRNLLRLWSET